MSAAVLLPVAFRRTVLRADYVWKSYEAGSIRVLNGVDLDIIEGQTVAIYGPSGCGKSTLLHLLAGLDEPDRGHISVNDVKLSRGRSRLHLLRHEIGFVFQLHNLIPDLTLEENCLVPAVAAGVGRQAAKARLRELTSLAGLNHRLDHKMRVLSAGDRRRSALCRALLNKPKILLADEPTGSLDEETGAAVFQLLLDLVAKEGLTLVMATHDRAIAAKCDRLVEMRIGRIHEPKPV